MVFPVFLLFACLQKTAVRVFVKDVGLMVRANQTMRIYWIHD